MSLGAGVVVGLCLVKLNLIKSWEGFLVKCSQVEIIQEKSDKAYLITITY